MAEYVGTSSDTKPTGAAVALGAKYWETDTDKIYEWDGDSWLLKSIGGAACGYEASLGAGDEGVDSPTLSRKRINNRAHLTKLASSATAQSIGGSGVPVYIKSIRVFGTMAGTLTLAGLSTPTSVAALANTIVLPAVTVTNGVPVDILPSGVSRAFQAGCNITMSVAADGLLVLVEWEEMP